jgi:hypothetical protein
MKIQPLSEARSEDRLNVLVISDSGMGKSTICSTLPKPILYADVGGGAHSIPAGEGKTIDGVKYSQEGIDIAYPQNWMDLLTFFTTMWRSKPSPEALKFGERYASVVLDMLTECNFHLILNEVVGSEEARVTQNDWGVIGKKVKVLARKAKELANVKRFPDGPHVVVTALRKDKALDSEAGIFTGKIGPMLSGQCLEDVPGVFDLVTQIRVRQVKGLDGKPRRVRMLQTESDGVYMARSRFPGLKIYEPTNFSAMWEKIQNARKELRSGQGKAAIHPVPVSGSGKAAGPSGP